MRVSTIILGTAGLGLATFVGIRLQIRKVVRTAMTKKYQTDKFIYGSAFLLAAYGKLPKHAAPTDAQVAEAIKILATGLVPIWSLYIPDEIQTENYVQDRALAAGFRDLASLADTPWVIEESIKRGAGMLAHI